MTEQDKFKYLLQKLIQEIESENITSVDELINVFVKELQESPATL